MKVLLCDSDESNIDLFEKYLTQEGHRVIVAKDGIEVLENYNQIKPDLVFLDEHLPKADVYEVIEKIKEMCDSISDWTPIAFISKNLSDDVIEAAIGSGADFFLAKPVSTHLIKAKVQTTRRIISFRQNLIDFSRQLRDLNDKLISSNQLLSDLSLKDPLTLLANRRAFEENLERLCRQACRHDTPISLLMIDVDHFKPYNDTYGHQAGDVCLQKVAKALQQSSHRAKDIVARYGGEEFSVILPETNSDEATIIAERIRNAVEVLKLKNVGSPKGYVTVSIGVSTSKPGVDFASESLVAAGDEALYQAKENGRNTFVVAEREVNQNKNVHLSSYKTKRRPASDKVENNRSS